MSTDPTAADSGVMPGDEQSTTDIVRRTEQAVKVMPLMSDEEIRRTWRIAQALAASKMFKDTYQAEQAFGKILIGRDLGLSPSRALMTIDLVKGNIQMRGTLLASFVREHPDYDYRVLEKTAQKCRLLFRRRWEGEWEDLGEEEFTLEDAKRAGLVKADGAYTTYPKNMLFWRALSNGVKFFCPELMHGMPVYVEGELDQSVSAAPSSGGGEAAALPSELAELVARAHAVDSHAWRRNEILARLPHPDADGYAQAVEQLAREIRAWLSEREPTDAEVVVDGEGSIEAAEAASGAQDEPHDLYARLSEQHRTDEEWRLQVDALLSRYADLEAAVETAEDRARDELHEELDRVQGDLDALGVPVGWWPVSDEQSTLGV